MNEALRKQSIATQYIRILRKLYKDFKIIKSPFTTILGLIYREVFDKAAPSLQKHLQLTIREDVMREFGWDEKGMKIGGQQIHNLRFANNIVNMGRVYRSGFEVPCNTHGI